jgi:colicin import membrane protein
MKTRFDKRSTDVLFDESVSKAIERSNPLPPFPEGYRKTNEELEINFNLKDLEKN